MKYNVYFYKWERENVELRLQSMDLALWMSLKAKRKTHVAMVKVEGTTAWTYTERGRWYRVGSCNYIQAD